MSRRSRSEWVWSVGLASGAMPLAIAIDSADPCLLAFAPWLTPALAAAGAVGAIIAALRARRRGGPGRWALALLWLAVPAVLAGQEAAAGWQRRHVLAAGPEARVLGEHFIVGYAEVGEVLPLAARGLIGGVFVTRRNVQGRSADALRREIAGLQDVRRAAGLPPLIVATDQEGGIVSRLAPPLTALPPLASLAGLDPGPRATAARAYGERQGRELAGLGVTVDLAPVLDLRVDRPPDPLDFNSLIAQRAIADDPAVVAAVAIAYGHGLEAAGVTPTMKHFPGLGRVAADTHWFSARLDVPLADLEARDWMPFRAMIADSAGFLMIGHVTIDALDRSRLAWQSPAVVEGLLRRRWGFRGVVITDDLTMEPVYRAGLCRAVVDGLQAGVDLFLIADDGARVYPALDCALQAWRDGRLDPGRLGESRARLPR